MANLNYCRLSALLVSNYRLFNIKLNNINKIGNIRQISICNSFLMNKSKSGIPEPKVWPMYNQRIYPPLKIGEKIRPAFVCHSKNNIKYSPLKLWYCACLVRGMKIDEAIRQLDYIDRKGAKFVKETLIEAQELAVQKHNVEFRSNLWVAESFSGPGLSIKGYRRHARGRIGLITYRYSHYFVRLEEGDPPENYYPQETDGPTHLQQWIQERRNLRIGTTL